MSKSAKKIKNTKSGYHLNSKHWQDYKRKLPPLSDSLFSSALGMLLGDAGSRRVGREAHMKFEQGKDQKDFLFHLFDLFKDYRFMEKIGVRFEKNRPNIKSYWFKTFSHSGFTKLYNLFHEKGKVKKQLSPNLIKQHVVAYWLMSDGSLQGGHKQWIIHSQSFSYSQNVSAAGELNHKFSLQCSLIPHKGKYWVIRSHVEDCEKIANLVSPYIIPSMRYKLPSKWR